MSYFSLDRIITELGVDQRKRPARYCVSESDEKETPNLGYISELTRQVSLDILKNYRLIDLKVESENSFIASVLTLLDENFPKLDWEAQEKFIKQLQQIDEQTIARQVAINIIVWSNTQLTLYPAHQQTKIDHQTIIIFRNKYGQHYPVVANFQKIHSAYASAKFHNLNSILLIKLLNKI